ncbi:hypothetical protein COT42_07335 [Candidatus Saganbacteria bacterium CG08_land_8_20_14_0_20_45_16]|uniref:Uncharacterized protein n=1 Tax=Candidatus Saganbacteria bacterium CG08_land_8_20_14_0_20_45_16 TaxID=2014293 RepID=A0A2H0XUQ8_UNCSA|nr:MAG: hypothetical protein COT42_07335 [Candidatus Saganbacteria bacterium CG08_land_8_20_14_0_20_45_16]
MLIICYYFGQTSKKFHFFVWRSKAHGDPQRLLNVYKKKATKIVKTINDYQFSLLTFLSFKPFNFFNP